MKELGKRILRSVLVLGSVAASALAAEDGEQLFAAHVLPLFREKCLACHGDDEKKMKGGLDMRTLEALRKGGDSGEASVVPGRPEKSPLYLAATRAHEDEWEPMPPKENDKLTPEQIGYIREWITAGAVWPDADRLKELAKRVPANTSEDGVAVRTSGGLSGEWTSRKYKPEHLWAYQALTKPQPPAPGNPIDAFIAARVPAGLPVAPAADRRTLIRRATFDLLGLPPTPVEVDAFLADKGTDAEAFAKVVERLLGSPHYGERWARHWLDVVRYADSSGFANDYARGNAWRYRDYVVRAFNTDKPYGQFVREQIAGDELDPNNAEFLIAAGFLRMGPWESTSMEVPKVARQRFLDDVTQSVGETFLAQAVQCSRCHDHKFDPMPTRDYYSLQAVFGTTQLAERPAKFLPEENRAGFEEKRYLEQRRQHYLSVLKTLDERSLAAADAWFREKGINRTAWDRAVAEVRKAPVRGRRGEGHVFDAARKRMGKSGVPETDYPPKLLGFGPEDFGLERVARKGLERLAWDLDRYEPVALSVYNGVTREVPSVSAPVRIPSDRMRGGELEETRVLPGGDPFGKGERVTPAVLSAPSAVSGMRLARFELTSQVEGRRKALADWVTSPGNPLTARVMVNRIWLGHFGQAIAGNPNNFGATGKQPTHPGLLDWLAASFIEQGWSVKSMHRMIMNSAAYQRASQHPDAKLLGERDPEGNSYAAFKPRRLTAEELRDAMLSASGELNPLVGGIPVRPEMNLEAALQPRQVMGSFAEAWQPSPLPEQRHRRSLYALKIRGQRDPSMEVFNEPSPDLSCEAREASTVTPQVFALFNSQASLDRALAFAARLMKEAEGREEAIERAFMLSFSRPPSREELAACLRHWAEMTARHQSLTFQKRAAPREVVREAVEENTGERFKFTEPLEAAADFVPDLQMADASPETRGLAEVCLVLLNTNEFSYVY